MMLNKRQIENNINWLLAHGSSPVRYLTHKHLLKSEPRSKVMKELWADVEKCSAAEEIFSRQEADGSWYSGGSWSSKPAYMPKHGYSAFTPKYVTTVWILPILGDMGFDIQDKRVKRACEYTLFFQKPKGMFSRFKMDQSTQLNRQGLENEDPANFPCELSVYLQGLGKVGMGRDARLQKSYDLLIRWQREDGGWVNQKHKEERNWTRSCPWVTHHATAALYYSQIPEYQNPLRKALKFLVGNLSIKKDHEIQKFYYHGHSMVRELLMFSEMGIGMEEYSVQVVLEWLLSMYCAKESCFRYQGKPIAKCTRKEAGASTKVLKYRLYHLIEDDWLTYYMTRIVMNVLKH